MKHQTTLAHQIHRSIMASAGALGLLLAGLSPAQAAVESGHWEVINQNVGYAFDHNLGILVDQTPDGDYTGTFLNYDAQAGSLSFVTYNTDEGSTLFVTRPGQFINDQTLINLPASDRVSFSSNVAQVGTDFYLGVATEKYTDPGFRYDDQHWTVFGWAHFKADAQGKLQIIDSAMSFKEGGIVAGSLAVPEASSWSLMALGLFGLTWATRQKRQTGTGSIHR